MGLDRYLLTNDAVAVNRFYFASASSHFLTADRGERDHLRALNPSAPSDADAWALEGISFYILAPQNGSRPSETTAAHTLFDGSPVTGPRHRYTARLDIINTMTRQGWKQEGVAMCAPNF